MNRMLLLGAVVWTLLVSGMLGWHLFDSRRHIEHLAHESASENIHKDVLYRLWSSEHGGVYVPVTEKTQPNPYLKDVKERDITSPSGRKLTLINPAYMTRQVHELSKGKSGVTGHITSLKPIRPENRPDEWEKQALIAIENGKKEHGEIVVINDAAHYRLMTPLFVQEPCLKCHASQGYKLGDLRGGISASVPMTVFSNIQQDHLASELKHFSLAWLLGLAGMLLAKPYIGQRIREQQKAVALLEESERRTRSIVDNAPFGAYLYRLEQDGRLIFIGANVSADMILSVDNRQFIGKTIEEAFPQLANTHIPDTYRRVAVTGRPAALEHVDYNEGQIRGVFEVHAFQTEPNQIAVFFRDVTEEKKADDALRVSEERFRTIVDTSLEGILTIDGQAVITFVNARMLTMLGYSREEFLGRSILDFIHEEERPDQLQQLELRRQGLASEYERRFQRKDGMVIWTRASASPLFDERGVYMGAFGMYADITARKQMEDTLRNSEEQFRLLLDSTGEAIYGINEAGTCTFCNPTCVRLLGYRGQEELLGKNMHELMHHTRKDGTPYPLRECKVVGTIEHGAGAHINDEVFWRADGTSFPVEYWSYPQVRDGRIAGAVVTFVEITERLRLEDQLRHAQKMEAVGTLAGGIAHDFNNIMMAIMGYAHLLKMGQPSMPQSAMAVDEIIAASERAAQLTQGLLAFSRKQVMLRKALDANEVVRSFRNLIGRMLREDIELCLQLAQESVMIDADRGQIEQVLMNLFTNARDAMPKGGRISITTGVREIQAKETGRFYVQEPGRYGNITVSDSGQGMDEATLGHIFEPFFTTKEVGKGTGLGLSMVYGIIKKHNGSIIVSSLPGSGTTVSLYLPLALVQPPASSARHEYGRLTGSELILVVEDDEGVRTVVRDILARHGYVILEAVDGVRGAELFREKQQEIRLVISDLVMPGKSGWDMVQEIKTVRPNVKTLFLSGYDRSMVPDQEAGSEEVSFLQKPLNPKELLAKVREMLDT